MENVKGQICLIISNQGNSWTKAVTKKTYWSRSLVHMIYSKYCNVVNYVKQNYTNITSVSFNILLFITHLLLYLTTRLQLKQWESSWHFRDQVCIKIYWPLCVHIGNIWCKILYKINHYTKLKKNISVFDFVSTSIKAIDLVNYKNTKDKWD